MAGIFALNTARAALMLSVSLACPALLYWFIHHQFHCIGTFAWVPDSAGTPFESGETEAGGDDGNNSAEGPAWWWTRFFDRVTAPSFVAESSVVDSDTEVQHLDPKTAGRGLIHGFIKFLEITPNLGCWAIPWTLIFVSVLIVLATMALCIHRCARDIRNTGCARLPKADEIAFVKAWYHEHLERQK